MRWWVRRNVGSAAAAPSSPGPAISRSAGRPTPRGPTLIRIGRRQVASARPTVRPCGCGWTRRASTGSARRAAGRASRCRSSSAADRSGGLLGGGDRRRRGGVGRRPAAVAGRRRHRRAGADGRPWAPGQVLPGGPFVPQGRRSSPSAGSARSTPSRCGRRSRGSSPDSSSSASSDLAPFDRASGARRPARLHRRRAGDHGVPAQHRRAGGTGSCASPSGSASWPDARRSSRSGRGSRGSCTT